MEITCDDPSLCRSLPPNEYAKTMAVLAAASRRYSAGTMSKAAFSELEGLGSVTTPTGLVSPRLCS